MSLLPNDDDYAAFVDGDTMFLTANYGKQISDIIEKYKDHNVGLFTCYTNRTGNAEQCYKGVISEDGEIRNHRAIALELQKTQYDQVKELTNIISGHLMVVQKKIWRDVGFFADELSDKMKTRYTKNLLAVDNRFSKRILKNNYKIYLMEGVYLMHYYRLCEGKEFRDHLGAIK